MTAAQQTPTVLDSDAHQAGNESFIDPQCGMTVAPTSPHRATRDGREYRFCSARCRDAFVGAGPPAAPGEPPAAAHAEAPPLRPSSGDAAWTCPMHPEVRRARQGDCPECGMALERAVPAAAATHIADWTCPMHPQVSRNGPGSCPICGMALERRAVDLAAADDDDPELRAMTRRLVVSVVLSVPLVLLAMVAPMAGAAARAALASRALPFVELALASPVVL